MKVGYSYTIIQISCPLSQFLSVSCNIKYQLEHFVVSDSCNVVDPLVSYLSASDPTVFLRLMTINTRSFTQILTPTFAFTLAFAFAFTFAFTHSWSQLCWPWPTDFQHSIIFADPRGFLFIRHYPPAYFIFFSAIRYTHTHTHFPGLLPILPCAAFSFPFPSLSIFPRAFRLISLIFFLYWFFAMWEVFSFRFSAICVAYFRSLRRRTQNAEH